MRKEVLFVLLLATFAKAIPTNPLASAQPLTPPKDLTPQTPQTTPPKDLTSQTPQTTPSVIPQPPTTPQPSQKVLQDSQASQDPQSPPIPQASQIQPQSPPIPQASQIQDPQPSQDPQPPLQPQPLQPQEPMQNPLEDEKEVAKQLMELLDSNFKGFYILPVTFQMVFSIVVNMLIWCLLPKIGFFKRILMNEFSKELSLISNTVELKRFA